MRRHELAAVMAAARILFNADRIEKADEAICIVRKSSGTIAERTYLSNVAIDWGDSTSYETPKPWRPARMPDDWGKPALFASRSYIPGNAHEPNGTIAGREADTFTASWLMASSCTLYPYCWVRDE